LKHVLRRPTESAVESGHWGAKLTDMITSADEFRRLRTSSKPEEQARAASEEAPEGVWREVIQTDPEMRPWVAQNKTVPLIILRMLASDEDQRVRNMVAMKRKLDAELFALLATDEDAAVRHTIACNRSAPREVLTRLSKDEEQFVARAATERLLA
jgi:hypothetical protein